MEGEHKRKIEELMGGINCPKEFSCCQSDFDNLCKARDIGMQSYLECLEENPRDCTFSLGYADSYYCKCPLRRYIAKHMGK